MGRAQAWEHGKGTSWGTAFSASLHSSHVCRMCKSCVLQGILAVAHLGCRVSKMCLCLLACWKSTSLKPRTFPRETICQTPAPMCSKSPIYCHPSTATHCVVDCSSTIQVLLPSASMPAVYIAYVYCCCMPELHCGQSCTNSIQRAALLLPACLARFRPCWALS